MKKGWLVGVLIGFLFLFTVPTVVQADDNRLLDIFVEVELLQDGTAIITEHRQMDMQEGTELYIVIEEDGVEVIDFEVDGLSEVEEWESDQSREEKAGTYGILEKGDGVELVWGIGNYGEQTYVVSYTLTNIVRQLDDGQSLYWNFDTFGDIRPENLEIEISGPFTFTEENTRIWAFGYEGMVELVDGKLETYANEPLESGNPASVLMQFSNAPFLLSASLDYTLEEQLEIAESNRGRGDSSGSDRVFIAIFASIGAAVVSLIAILFRVDHLKKEQGKMPTGYAQRKRNKGMLLTEVPYKNGEITDIAFLLSSLQKGSFEQYFFAYLLKWSKDKCITIETNDHEKKRKRKTTLTFLPEAFKKKRDNTFNHSDFEETLWETLLEATNVENKITNKEMEKWVEKNYEEILSMQKDLIEESTEVLEREGYLEMKSIKYLTITSSFIAITKKGQRLFDHLTQFENHLNSLAKDSTLSYRQLIPEGNFLIWASLYGKEEDVITRLEELMPDWDDHEQEYIPYYYTYYHGLHVFSDSVHSGTSAAGYSSSGAGGATSVGGGGGAMGGGGGGAR